MLGSRLVLKADPKNKYNEEGSSVSDEAPIYDRNKIFTVQSCKMDLDLENLDPVVN